MSFLNACHLKKKYKPTGARNYNISTRSLKRNIDLFFECLSKVSSSLETRTYLVYDVPLVRDVIKSFLKARKVTKQRAGLSRETRDLRDMRRKRNRSSWWPCRVLGSWIPNPLGKPWRKREAGSSAHGQLSRLDRVLELSVTSHIGALGNPIYTSINRRKVAAPSGWTDKPGPGWRLVHSGWKQENQGPAGFLPLILMRCQVCS